MAPGDQKLPVTGELVAAVCPGRLQGDPAFQQRRDETSLPQRFSCGGESPSRSNIETGDWVTVLFEEALRGDLDLRNWQEVMSVARGFMGLTLVQSMITCRRTQPVLRPTRGWRSKEHC